LDDPCILSREAAQEDETPPFRDQPPHWRREILGSDSGNIREIPGDGHGSHSSGACRQLGRREMVPNAVQGEPVSTMIFFGRRSVRTKSTPWPTSSFSPFMSSVLAKRYLRPSSARMTPVPNSGRNLVISP